MVENGRRTARLVTVLLLTLAATALFHIHPALADVPSVLSIEAWTSETDTVLNITVTHSSPTSSHYVNTVEVDVNGTIYDIDLAPQSTVTFIVQYDMGELIAEVSVQARAHCNLHGWSDWSSPVVVPEFSFVHVLPVLAVVSIAVLLFREVVMKNGTFQSKRSAHR
ncbi:MAG: hypothetical protein OEZ29_03490 [Candidatus Bathyarchaeota archaeon]|nr:hypothetical protein [Candidatus Bathyarchaeota archaeon]MDH5779637.1 hypothetical protein [Candidatus Bathyarchaeota archaeon]